MSPVVHQFFDLLRIVGLRDRLRCPHCRKVGTWKPHGGWLDFADGRKVRRWLCKWCGWYMGPEGVKRARYNETRGWWVLDDDRDAWEGGETPDEFAVCDPWAG